MIKTTTRIPISEIILDEEIYPRDGLNQKRVGIFAENIRDGFKFDPIEVQAHPDVTGKYRILDGVHRWSAYKATGVTELEVIIKNLDGVEPLLYAAKKARRGPGFRESLVDREMLYIVEMGVSRWTGSVNIPEILPSMPRGS